MQVASSSPSTNVSYNAIGQTLGSWVVTTYGEPIKITSLNVGFNDATGTGNSNLAATLRNGYVTINGAQYGSTQSVPCSYDAAAGSTCSNTVGTPFQVNYIVQPGTPVVVSFVADLYDNNGTGQLANGDTIQAKLISTTGNQNAQGQTSLSTVYLPGGTAATTSTSYTVTVTTGTISGTANGSYSNQTTVAPQNNLYKLGSYYINGSSVEPVNINTVNLQFGSATAGSASSGQASLLNNVQLTWNGVTETQVKGTVSASGNSWTVNHQIPVNGSALVEVWADILNLSPMPTAQIQTFLQATGLTANSGQSADTGMQTGQVITLGSGSLAVSIDPSTPVTGLVTGGQTGVPVAAFKFQATSDTYQITDLTFKVASTSTASVLHLVGPNGEITNKSVGSGVVSFSGLNIPVTAGGTTVLTVKLDVGNVGTGAGTPGTTCKLLCS